MTTLKTAVLGLGRIGWQFHLPSLAQHAGFDLAAVVDPLEERREEAAQQYGVRAYADLAALFDAEALDLVVIASPTHLHAEQAIAAMERGIDVFCDKPVAVSLDETDRMIAAMERTGRKLMVYQPHRITAEATALRQVMESGLLGPLYLIKRTISWYTRREDWQALQRYGGGMLNNYGAHYIDQILYLTGARIARVSCALRRVTSLGDADDVVKALLELDNGVILDMEINMAAALPMRGWYVAGQYGAATLAEDRSGFTVQYCTEADAGAVQLQQGLAAAARRYGNEADIPWHTAEFPLGESPDSSFYDACYAYYACDAASLVPIQDTREVMRILDACRRDAGWA